VAGRERLTLHARVSGLPEFMPGAELNRCSGSLDSPGYEEMTTNIDRHTETTPPLRKQPPI
jgi:hypothetical protein